MATQGSRERVVKEQPILYQACVGVKRMFDVIRGFAIVERTGNADVLKDALRS